MTNESVVKEFRRAATLVVTKEREVEPPRKNKQKKRLSTNAVDIILNV